MTLYSMLRPTDLVNIRRQRVIDLERQYCNNELLMEEVGDDRDALAPLLRDRSEIRRRIDHHLAALGGAGAPTIDDADQRQE